MNFNVYTTDFFDKELKRLSKKYPSIKDDYKALVDSLRQNQHKDRRLERNVIKSEWLSLLKEKESPAVHE